jgi:hypothetical protein
MERKVSTQSVVTYSIPESELIQMLMENAKDVEGRPLLPDPAEIKGVPTKIEFVYVYEDEEKHSAR